MDDITRHPDLSAAHVGRTVVHMDYSAALSAVITGLMEDAGISQTAMAQRADIAKATLQRRLGDAADLKTRELGAIARVLGTEPSTISLRAETLMKAKAAGETKTPAGQQ